MKKKKILLRVFCCLLCLCFVPVFSSCKNKKDSIVIMTEELSGLFNPFYATSGTDMDVVGMTQIGMLSTDKNGNTVAGDDLPTVVKAFDQKIVDVSDTSKETVYTFLIKNNIKFSDGKPLTINDVIFNMYEYLDPVYTGSSTMYSIKIKGLSQYRTQTNYSAGGDAAESQISDEASAYAKLRILELVSLFEDKVEENRLAEKPTSLTEAEMKQAINEHEVSEGYKSAVATEAEQATMTDDDYRKILLQDYELTLETFKKELESDFKAAKESFDLTTAPYSEWKEQFSNDIFKFFFFEGYITPEYETVEGKANKLKIVKLNNASIVNSFDSEEKAIERVYNDTIKTSLNAILTQWGTAGTLATQYSAASREIILHNNMSTDGTLAYPNISGIVSLGHTTNTDKVTINGVEYKVAREHNADGTPKNENEYDVLQITVEGTDPKAIYNFGFSVAPAHYYTADDSHPNGREIDIKNNKFGVEYASTSFQSKVIQSKSHVEIPVGAGAFKATNENNDDNPKGSDFWKSNVVYFKANHNFMFDVKAEKIRYQVVSSTNAIDKLLNGEVDYISPQFTKVNSDRLTQMENSGYVQLSSWQLGYGYIGINAGKIPNVNIRRAIMCAMQTSLALEYYKSGTCKQIDWPMSLVNWAYPTEDDGVTSKPNEHDYMQWTSVNDAKDKIKRYMDQAQGESLKITFTIAGASITEHPTFAVFQQAASILNDMGWDVEVKPDSQALTKLSTGSLEVWAAAWGSTIDPDMYQVYHKNSSATSVYSWGYREIKSNQSLYPYEYETINELSLIIDEARSIMYDDKQKEQQERKELYEEAMNLVLDLAVEMPVYQRMTLYAYNGNTIKGLTNDVNPYTSPLERIWELELVD